MELAGGLILGITLMFSLLAFNPSGTPWFDRLVKSFSTPPSTEQIAGIGSAEINAKPEKHSLALSSAVFSNGNIIPIRYTCDGISISPQLSISGVPEKTQSLVLIMEDPDAPNGIWTHWVVFNIPPTVHEIAEGKESPGRAGKNSWGKIGYGALCPPASPKLQRGEPKEKEHRYIFHLYALSRTLPLRVGSSKAEVLNAMKGYVLAQTELTARYKRSK